ncbi:hypothetical protein Plhal304r1_c022g0077921 [Plasmopara halstedii]
MSTIYSKASENVCMWKQQSSDVCDSPRSCYDCLNTPVGDGIDCTITSAGLCTTLDEYLWQEDYRLNRSDTTSHYFPSTNTTYCDINDSVCTKCRSSQFKESASQFCVGLDGCVCVSLCESPDYTTTIAAKYCATLDFETADGESSSLTDTFIVLTLGFIIPVIVYHSYARRVRNRLVHEEIHNDRRAVKGPVMPLVGWKKHRADLMANQRIIMSVDSGVVASKSVIEGHVSGNATIDASLSTLSASTVSIEREDSLADMTSSGRCLSSSNTVSMETHRQSMPIMSWSEESVLDENDMIGAQFTQLEDHIV